MEVSFFNICMLFYRREHAQAGLYKAFPRELASPLTFSRMEINMAKETKRCAHPNCSCQVQSRQKYCSAQCERADRAPDIDGECEYPGCTGRID
jgi:hypothetical protein